MLSKADEHQYVSEMLARQLAGEAMRADSNKLQKDFVNRIVKSQDFLRAVNEGEVRLRAEMTLFMITRPAGYATARRKRPVRYCGLL